MLRARRGCSAWGGWWIVMDHPWGPPTAWPLQWGWGGGGVAVWAHESARPSRQTSKYGCTPIEPIEFTPTASSQASWHGTLTRPHRSDHSVQWPAGDLNKPSEPRLGCASLSRVTARPPCPLVRWNPSTPRGWASPPETAYPTGPNLQARHSQSQESMALKAWKHPARTDQGLIGVWAPPGCDQPLNLQ